MEFEIVSPILGFEEIKSIRLEKIDNIFANIIANNGVRWSLVNPYTLREYPIKLPLYAQALLDFNNNSSFEIYCMMILQKPLEDSKINFLAPLIFNITNKKVLQIYYQASEYPDFVKLESLRYFNK